MAKPLKAISKVLAQIEIQNDANCVAWQSPSGAGKGNTLSSVSLFGTAAAEALFTRVKVITAAFQSRSEWGTRTINPKARFVIAASVVCVESYISGGGAEARYFEQYGEFNILHRTYELHRRELKPVESGQPSSHFRPFLATLIAFLDPDIVVLGAGSRFRRGSILRCLEVAQQVFSDSLETAS
jgi:predicted NBD/HSP70 family sugar kinase